MPESTPDDENVSTILIEYADASAHANDDMNATVPTVIDRRGKPCTPSMARARDAELAVLALVGQPDLPAAVTDFLAANADSGCASCWLSSFRGRNHPECNAKITRWFAARSALRAFGSQLAAGAKTDA